MSKMLIERSTAEQALEALEAGPDVDPIFAGETADALRAALAEPVLQTCNCRWDGETQVQQCTLHEAHVDAIHEWAERAKTAEKKLAAVKELVQEPVAWSHINGTSDTKWHPPHRRPLSDADLAKIWDDALDQLDPRDQLRFIARAIERAHGIGGEG